MIAGTSANGVFASEQARQALDVFVQETERWHWRERSAAEPQPNRNREWTPMYAN